LASEGEEKIREISVIRRLEKEQAVKRRSLPSFREEWRKAIAFRRGRGAKISRD